VVKDRKKKKRQSDRGADKQQDESESASTEAENAGSPKQQQQQSKPSPSSVQKESERALFVAVENADTEAVKKYLKKGVSPTNYKNTHEHTALHWASAKKNLEILKLLLDAPNININVCARGNMTPLHYAAHNGNKESVKMLLAYGADRNIKNKKSQMPYDIAKNSKIKMMLSSKSNI